MTNSILWAGAYPVLALINLGVCIGVAWAALCRIHHMTEHDTAPRFRAVYVALLVAAVASALSPPLLGELPGVGQVLMGASVLAMLKVNSVAWQHGRLPQYMTKAAQPAGDDAPAWPEVDRRRSKT